MAAALSRSMLNVPTRLISITAKVGERQHATLADHPAGGRHAGAVDDHPERAHVGRGADRRLEVILVSYVGRDEDRRVTEVIRHLRAGRAGQIDDHRPRTGCHRRLGRRSAETRAPPVTRTTSVLLSFTDLLAAVDG